MEKTKSVDKISTREASSIQENRVANKLGGRVNSNSGAGLFNKGDVIIDDLMLVECKTCMSPKESFSIKKEWLDKNKKELMQVRLPYHCIAFNFNYADKKDYYVIDDILMQFLVEKLKEDM